MKVYRKIFFIGLKANESSILKSLSQYFISSVNNIIDFYKFYYDYNDCITKIINSQTSLKDDYSPFEIQPILYSLILNLNLKYSFYSIIEPRLIYIANSWLKIDEKAIFILTYKSPQNFLVENFEKNLITNEKELKSFLETWILYNKRLLEFYAKMPNNCIIINEEGLADDINNFIKLLNNNFEFDFSSINIISSPKSKPNHLFYLLLQRFLYLNPDAEDIYLQLNNLALINEPKQDFLNFDEILLQLIAYKDHISTLNILKEQRDKLMELYLFQDYSGMNPEGAVRLIKNDLSYKLGSVMVQSGKSVKKMLSLPFSLIKTYIEFKKENKTKNEALLPLESYSDYIEAVNIKKHLSYKLGETLIQNPFTFIFKINRIYKDFKKGRY